MNNSIPEIIYHYTTAEGLHSIISQNQIWATDIEFLNDAKELIYAREAVLNEIEHRAHVLLPGGKGHPDEAAASRATILKNISNELRRLADHKLKGFNRVHVTCFCEDGDLLSQWRAYGSGGGYALGFRTDLLLQTTTDLGGKSLALKKILYGIDDAQQHLSQALDDIAQQPTGHPGVTAEIQFGTRVLPLLAMIKHPSFFEEKEWRLLTTGYNREANLNFRPNFLGLVPYIKLKFPPEALVIIIVGPGNERDLRSSAVQMLASKYSDNRSEHPRNIDVVLSDTPLRR